MSTTWSTTKPPCTGVRPGARPLRHTWSMDHARNTDGVAANYACCTRCSLRRRRLPAGRDGAAVVHYAATPPRDDAPRTFEAWVDDAKF